MVDSDYPLQRTLENCMVYGSMGSIPSLLNEDPMYSVDVVGEEELYHNSQPHSLINHNLENNTKYSDSGVLPTAGDDSSVPSLVDERDYEDADYNHRRNVFVDISDPPVFRSSNSVDFVLNHIIMPKQHLINHFEKLYEERCFSQSLESKMIGHHHDRVDDCLFSLSSNYSTPRCTTEKKEIPIEIVVSSNHDHSLPSFTSSMSHHQHHCSESGCGHHHLNIYHMDEGWEIATYTSQDIDVDIPSVLEQLVGGARKRQKTMDNATITSLTVSEPSAASSSCVLLDHYPTWPVQSSAPPVQTCPLLCLSMEENLTDALDEDILDKLYSISDPSIETPQPENIADGCTVTLQSNITVDATPSTCGYQPVLPALESDTGASITKKKKRRRQSKRPNYEPAVKIYVVPNDKDVLMGRGGRTNHHPGNHLYLEQKKIIQPRYLAATKEEKTGISQELVDAVHSWGGRFLKQDPIASDPIHESEDDNAISEYDDNRWYEVLNIVARKKASQTLREVSPQKKS